jgi:hypothetical protein
MRSRVSKFKEINLTSVTCSVATLLQFLVRALITERSEDAISRLTQALDRKPRPASDGASLILESCIRPARPSRPHWMAKEARSLRSINFTLLCFRGSIMINGIPSACPYPVMGSKHPALIRQNT